MWFRFYIFAISKILINAEVFTLIKQENVTCVLTGESVYSGLYISSKNKQIPATESVVRRPVTELTQWISDDWNVTNTNEYSFYPLEDIRWEDLEEVETEKVELNPKFTAFSFCFKNQLNVIVEDDFPNMEIMHLLQENKLVDSYSCLWFHYVLMENKMLQIINENGTRKVEKSWGVSVTPKWLHFKKNNVHLKIHDYNFRFSNSTTFSDKVAYLDISNITDSKNVCISMFVSIDAECFLDVVLETGNASVTQIIEGFNNETIRSWKRIEIRSSYGGTGKLLIYRTRSDDKRTGFWAIDKVHLCKPQTDIYRTRLKQEESQNHICRTLDAKSVDGDVLCSKPGFFGKKCEVNCSDVFEESLSFCQSHQICLENGKCECAWGYQTPKCNKTCDVTFWGLQCASRYNLARCQTYNSIQGCTTCNKKLFGNQCSEKFPVVLKPPVLTSIKENKIEIFFGKLHYSRDETQPEFYQIQYKQAKAHDFINGSGLIPYSSNSENERFVIRNVNTKEFEYHIRIILIVQNVFFDDVPKLITFKKTLVVSDVENKSIDLKWVKPFASANKFLIHYECEDSLNSTNTIINNITTSTTLVKVEILKQPLHCKFQLYVLDGNTTRLVDEADVSLSNLSENIKQKSESNVTILGENISGFFEKISQPAWNSSDAAYPVQQVNSKDDGNNKLAYILISVFCVITIFGVFGFLYIKRRLKSNLNNEEILNINEIPLLSSRNEHQNDSKNIKIEELENYLNFSLVVNTCAKEEFGVFSRFQSLSNEKDRSVEVALREENISKNRNRNYVPYDSTRVVLQDLEGVGSGDYINASYIDGYQNPKAYIACQGPKFSTTTDFWRMIWQEKVEFIIMATNFTESDGARDCAEYWSAGLNTVSEFESMKIKMIFEKEYQNYYHRRFEVRYLDAFREITHFQVKWSSKEENILYANDILPIIKQLNQISETCTSPIVVHSGVGTDRNGTLILCDLALRMAQHEKSVNFYKLLEKMREQRPHMVETVNNYVLAHLSVLEFFMEQENPFKKSFDVILNTNPVEEQKNYLERISWHDSVLQFLKSETRSNKLVRFTAVDGYRTQKQFLLCKHPTKGRLSDFWSTVKNENIKYVLKLDTVKNNMWPYKFNESDLTIQVVQMGKVETADLYRMSQLLLVTYDNSKTKVLNEQEIWFFELQNWTTESTVSLVHTVNSIKNVVADYQKPVSVLCQDGINSSGLFTILFYAFEKYGNELEVDICTPLRILKRSNPEFSVTSRDLKFIYDAIFEYLQHFDQYKHIYTKKQAL